MCAFRLLRRARWIVLCAFWWPPSARAVPKERGQNLQVNVGGRDTSCTLLEADDGVWDDAVGVFFPSFSSSTWMASEREVSTGKVDEVEPQDSIFAE